ncbi:hypothetical protein RUM44_008251 [Polyplax serrata]|uniref:Uncharacterized protein n=1 Tax=Polyplax serrata TaxID=468196 RepID=A0ABR1BBT6_POLSC
MKTFPPGRARQEQMRKPGWEEVKEHRTSRGPFSEGTERKSKSYLGGSGQVVETASEESLTTPRKHVTPTVVDNSTCSNEKLCSKINSAGMPD